MLIDNNPAIFYVWNNISLKWKIVKYDMSVTMEAIKINENPYFLDDEFIIPNDFTINNITTNNK